MFKLKQKYQTAGDIKNMKAQISMNKDREQEASETTCLTKTT